MLVLAMASQKGGSGKTTLSGHLAVEAEKAGAGPVALIDTDSDPDLVDLPIPGNDDSIRSIDLMLRHLSDAVLEGKATLPEAPKEEAPGPAPVPSL